MSHLPSDPDPQHPNPSKGINQQADNTLMKGGMQAAVGDNNVQIQGDSNWINFFQNVFLFGQEFAKDTQPRESYEQLLIKSVKEEITYRLAHSLHNEVRISLGIEEHLFQVKCPYDVEIKIGKDSTRKIPSDRTILDVFDQGEVSGKILILGQPGVGKTTTLLDLAKALLERAESNIGYPMPVILNLSLWRNNKQEFHEWICSELKSYRVPVNISRQWLQNRQLTLMLDGLDEHREPASCIHAINQLIQNFQPHHLIVCSRYEPYTYYKIYLQLNTAISIHPLNGIQIQNYLINIGREDLWHGIQNNYYLQELVRTPLFLNIAVLAGQGLSINQWRNQKNPEKFLIEKYIDRMLIREIRNQHYHQGRNPTSAQTKEWLTYLAWQLNRDHKTEFLIEDMQPDWLPTGEAINFFRVLCKLLFGLSLGVFLGFLTGAIFLFDFGIYAPIAGIMLGFFIGIFSSLPKSIKVVEALRWSPERAVRISAGTFIIVLQKIIIATQALRPSYRYSYRWNIFHELGYYIASIIWLACSIVCLTVGLILGLILGSFGWIGGFVSKEDRSLINFYPNQGIERSIESFQLITLFGTIYGGVLFSLIGLMIFSIPGLFQGLSIGILFGVVVGVIIGLEKGGKAVFLHFILRLMLWLEGYIPWNYSTFLDYCNERLLLQRVGGRYKFMHKLIQDHFANMSR